MELRHLRYFAQVGQTLSFRRAAERLHISRPALSMQIRDLEEEMGVRLLDRTTTRVRLTEAGSVFLAEVADILTRVDRATQRAQDAAAGLGGRLVIGEMGPLTPSLLPVALRRFRHLYPKVDVTIMDVDKYEQVAALRDGRLDLSFLIDLDLHLPEGICSRPVLTSRIGLAVGLEHRLAQRKSVALYELVEETFVANTHRRAKGHLEHTREAFARANLPVPRVVGTDSFEGLVTMIAAEQGVAIMPEMFAEVRPMEVVFVPILGDLPVPEITLLAVWLEVAASPLVLNLIEAFNPPESGQSATAS